MSIKKLFNYYYVPLLIYGFFSLLLGLIFILLDTVTLIVVSLVLASVLIVSASWFLSRKFESELIRPIQVIKQGVAQFSHAQLQHEITLDHSVEINELAHSLNQMAEKLSAQMVQSRRLQDIKSDFVANVSHELKTPITTIRGFVETLLDGAMDNREDLERFLGIVKRQVERISTLMDDLLTLAKLEHEHAPIEMIQTNLLELARAAIEIINYKAEEKGIQVRIVGEQINSKVNPGLIEQALVNLLDNAIKYSGTNSEIEISIQSTLDDIVISVNDHGHGIEEQHLCRLFERFYRIDKGRSRAQGGTGLGLAIVKHIAFAHGGNVSVESKLGKGSSFSMHIPHEPFLSMVGNAN